MILCRQTIKHKLKLFSGSYKINLLSGFLFSLFAIYAFFELKNRPVFVDEFFLIRASYIQFHLPSISPQHVTPITFLCGLLFSWTDSLKTMFLSARFFDFSIFLYALWVVPVQLIQKNSARIWFLLIMLIHPTMFYFQSQAKYDAVIFVISLLYVGLIRQKKMLGNFALFLSAILLTSTLKGVYYFLPFLFVLAWQFFVTTTDSANRKKIVLFLLKLLLLVAFFIFVFSLFGVADLFFATLKQQIWLSQGEMKSSVTSFRVSTVVTSGSFFYGLGIVSVIFLFKNIKLFLGHGSDLLLYLGSVMTLGWIYFLKHPNPFDPMVLAADLVLACLILIVFCELYRKIIVSTLALPLLIFIFGLQIAINPYFFTSTARAPLRGFSIAESEDILSRARKLIPPGSRVFDPLGLLYDSVPCSNQWYLDAPYRLKLLNGEWMKKIDWKSCDFALFSIQMTHLDIQTLGEISQEFEFTTNYPLMIKKVAPKQ